tara:strand:- start:8773 stop:12423 length:3651 start_codon:yes stop_codon:yes gene_type:complete
MASYIEGVQDYIPNLEVFTPDYQFLNNVLKTRQDRYDAGFEQVNQLYGQIVHAPLTNPHNIEKRQQYVDGLSEKIKQVSGLDLSLNQNITTARSLFKPFYEDKNMLFDMAWSQMYKDGMTQAKMYKESADEEVRKKYWDYGIRWMDIQKEKMVNSPLENIMSVPMPEYHEDPNLYARAVKSLSTFGPEGKGMVIQKPSTSPDDFWLYDQINGSLIYAEPVGERINDETGKKETIYHNPAMPYLARTLLNDPEVIDGYRIRAEVDAYDYGKAHAQQFGGDEKLARLNFMKTFIDDTTNTAIQQLAEFNTIHERDKNIALNWEAYQKQFGIVPGSQDEKLLKEFETKYFLNEQSMLSLRKDIQRIQQPTEEYNSMFNTMIYAYAMSMIDHDLTSATQFYGDATAKITRKHNPYKMEAIQAENRRNQAILESWLRTQEAIAKGEMANPGLLFPEANPMTGDASKHGYTYDDISEVLGEDFTVFDDGFNALQKSMKTDVYTPMMNDITKLYLGVDGIRNTLRGDGPIGTIEFVDSDGVTKNVTLNEAVPLLLEDPDALNEVYDKAMSYWNNEVYIDGVLTNTNVPQKKFYQELSNYLNESEADRLLAQNYINTGLNEWMQTVDATLTMMNTADGAYGDLNNSEFPPMVITELDKYLMKEQKIPWEIVNKEGGARDQHLAEHPNDVRKDQRTFLFKDEYEHIVLNSYNAVNNDNKHLKSVLETALNDYKIQNNLPAGWPGPTYEQVTIQPTNTYGVSGANTGGTELRIVDPGISSQEATKIMQQIMSQNPLFQGKEDYWRWEVPFTQGTTSQGQTQDVGAYSNYLNMGKSDQQIADSKKANIVYSGPTLDGDVAEYYDLMEKNVNNIMTDANARGEYGLPSYNLRAYLEGADPNLGVAGILSTPVQVNFDVKNMHPNSDGYKTWVDIMNAMNSDAGGNVIIKLGDWSGTFDPNDTEDDPLAVKLLQEYSNMVRKDAGNAKAGETRATGTVIYSEIGGGPGAAGQYGMMVITMDQKALNDLMHKDDGSYVTKAGDDGFGDAATDHGTITMFFDRDMDLGIFDQQNQPVSWIEREVKNNGSFTKSIDGAGEIVFMFDQNGNLVMDTKNYVMGDDGNMYADPSLITTINDPSQADAIYKDLLKAFQNNGGANTNMHQTVLEQYKTDLQLYNMKNKTKIKALDYDYVSNYSTNNTPSDVYKNNASSSNNQGGGSYNINPNFKAWP